MKITLDFAHIADNYYTIYHDRTSIGDMYWSVKEGKWKLTIESFHINLKSQYRHDIMEEAEILFNKAISKQG
jgi:hypothetical protein